MTVYVRYEDSEGGKKLIKKISGHHSLFLTLVSKITLEWVQIFFFFWPIFLVFFSAFFLFEGQKLKIAFVESPKYLKKFYSLGRSIGNLSTFVSRISLGEKHFTKLKNYLFFFPHFIVKLKQRFKKQSMAVLTELD